MRLRANYHRPGCQVDFFMDRLTGFSGVTVTFPLIRGGTSEAETWLHGTADGHCLASTFGLQRPVVRGQGLLASEKCPFSAASYETVAEVGWRAR